MCPIEPLVKAGKNHHITSFWGVRNKSFPMFTHYLRTNWRIYYFILILDHSDEWILRFSLCWKGWYFHKDCTAKCLCSQRKRVQQLQPVIMWFYFSLNKTPKYSNCIHWDGTGVVFTEETKEGEEKDRKETAPWLPSRDRFSYWCCLIADYLQAKIICSAIGSCACLANLLQEDGPDLWDHSVLLMGSAHSHTEVEQNWTENLLAFELLCLKTHELNPSGNNFFSSFLKSLYSVNLFNFYPEL